MSRATAIETMKRLEAAGILTTERVDGDPVRRWIDWLALAAAERPATKRGRNPTTRNRGVGTSDTPSEDLIPHDEGGGQKIRQGESEHLTRSVHVRPGIRPGLIRPWIRPVCSIPNPQPRPHPQEPRWPATRTAR
jgi:hypothetical protein